MAKTSKPFLTPDTLRGQLQQVGFRAELVTEGVGAPYIRSASNGVSFEIRLFNPLAGQADAYADLTFMAGMQLQAALPVEAVNRWNATKRFGRLYVLQGMLVLALDVLLQDRAETYLPAQIEIWDRLLQELLVYLRGVAAQISAKPAPEQEMAAGAVPPDIDNTDTRKPVLANGHAAPMSTDAAAVEPAGSTPQEGGGALRQN